MARDHSEADDVFSCTYFRRAIGGDRAWQWTSEDPRGTTLGASERGFRLLEKAIKNYLTEQGLSAWLPDVGMFAMPPGYALRKDRPGHYVLVRFRT